MSKKCVLLEKKINYRKVIMPEQTDYTTLCEILAIAAQRKPNAYSKYEAPKVQEVIDELHNKRAGKEDLEPASREITVQGLELIKLALDRGLYSKFEAPAIENIFSNFYKPIEKIEDPAVVEEEVVDEED